MLLLLCFIFQEEAKLRAGFIFIDYFFIATVCTPHMAATLTDSILIMFE